MNRCYDTEPPSVMSETWRVARQRHTCCECRREIKAGERYQVIKGLWDCVWNTYKTCEKCADLRESLSSIWCAPYGELRIEYIEYLDSIGAVDYNDDGEVTTPVNHILVGAR